MEGVVEAECGSSEGLEIGAVGGWNASPEPRINEYMKSPVPSGKIEMSVTRTSQSTPNFVLSMSPTVLCNTAVLRPGELCQPVDVTFEVVPTQLSGFERIWASGSSHRKSCESPFPTEMTSRVSEKDVD